jgi:MFS family permease
VNKHRGLIAVVLLFLGVRLLYPVLFVSAQNFTHQEDLVRGTLAHDLLHGGLKVPFWDYLADHYSGGSIVVGLLAVPFFLLFGSTLFVLRLVPLLFALALLVVWYVLVARNFDARTAQFTGLFFVLPPAVYLEGSSLAMGYHTESMLFSAVAFLLLLEMLRWRDGSLRWPAALGLTLGFGSWFCYTTFVSIAIVLVWWFWNDRRGVLRRPFALFVVFFALGFSPWIPANLSHDFRGLEFLEHGLRYDYLRGAPETAERVVKTALWYVPTMFDPFHGTRSPLWTVLFAAPFVGSMLYLVVRERRRAGARVAPSPGGFFVRASLVYVLAVSATRYYLHPYASLYLAPILPLLFGAAALALSDLWVAGRWPRAAASAVLGVAMVGGGIGLARNLDFRWPGASFAMPGYSHGQLASAIEARRPYDYAHYASLLPRVERTMTAAERSEFLRVMLTTNDYDLKRGGIAAEVRRFDAFPEPVRSIGYFQLGIALRGEASRPDEWRVQRLSQEHPTMSDGVRLGLVARRLQVPDVPIVDRLPLALDADTRIVFLDLSTHNAPDEFGWVRGGEETTFLVESARLVSAVEIRLSNGDRPNVATLTSAWGVRSFALAAGQSVVETLDPGIPASLGGHYYWKFSVRSRYGHFPILTRREVDARYLGVRVTVRPVPPLAQTGRT